MEPFSEPKVAPAAPSSKKVKALRFTGLAAHQHCEYYDATDAIPAVPATDTTDAVAAWDGTPTRANPGDLVPVEKFHAHELAAFTQSPRPDGTSKIPIAVHVEVNESEITEAHRLTK